MTKTILAVDDSRTIRKAIEFTFRTTEFEVHGVSNRAEALSRLASGQVDAIVVDAVLPDDDGYDVARELVSKGDGAPVLLLTSARHPFDAPRGASIGVIGFIDKPFQSQILIDRIQDAVAARGPARGPARGDDASSWSPDIDVEEIEAIDIEDVPEAEAESIDLDPLPSPAQDSSTPKEPPRPTVPAPPPPPREVNGSSPRASESRAPERPPAPPRPSNPPTPRLSEVDPKPEPRRPRSVQGDPESADRGRSELRSPVERVAHQASDELPSGLSREELRSMAQQVIERIAWEVVPELAEAIIREELQRLTKNDS
ncbi:MAG: response regulator transcription factor [Myxococcota bacterium]